MELAGCESTTAGESLGTDRGQVDRSVVALSVNQSEPPSLAQHSTQEFFSSLLENVLGIR